MILLNHRLWNRQNTKKACRTEALILADVVVDDRLVAVLDNYVRMVKFYLQVLLRYVEIFR